MASAEADDSDESSDLQCEDEVGIGLDGPASPPVPAPRSEEAMDDEDINCIGKGKGRGGKGRGQGRKKLGNADSMKKCGCGKMAPLSDFPPGSRFERECNQAKDNIWYTCQSEEDRLWHKETFSNDAKTKLVLMEYFERCPRKAKKDGSLGRRPPFKLAVYRETQKKERSLLLDSVAQMMDEREYVDFWLKPKNGRRDPELSKAAFAVTYEEMFPLGKTDLKGKDVKFRQRIPQAVKDLVINRDAFHRAQEVEMKGAEVKNPDEEDLENLLKKMRAQNGNDEGLEEAFSQVRKQLSKARGSSGLTSQAHDQTAMGDIGDFRMSVTDKEDEVEKERAIKESGSQQMRVLLMGIWGRESVSGVGALGFLGVRVWGLRFLRCPGLGP